MFGKYNGFVSNARVSACMYFLVEIINNTRGGIEGDTWERGNGGQIEILDEHHTILGLHLKPQKC
jgi:hypothetical protein